MSLRLPIFQVIIAVILSLVLSLAVVQLPNQYTKYVVVLLVIAMLTFPFLIGYIRYFWKGNTFLQVVLSLTIVTAFIGPGLVALKLGFISIFPFRLMIVVLIGCFFLYRKHKEGFVSEKQKLVYIFLLLWLGVGIASIVWAKDPIDSLKELITLLPGICLIVMVPFIYKKNRQYVEFFTLWIIMALLFIGIGLINHFLHIHLPVSRIAKSPAYMKSIPTALFANENDYASFLSISFFFFLALFNRGKYLFFKLVGLSGGLLALFLIIITSSRANLLAIALGLCVYFFILPARKKITYIALGLVGAGVGSLLFPRQVGSLVSDVLYQFSSLFGESKVTSASNDIRENLLKNAMSFLENTYGFGIGAGNAEYYMKNEALYNTQGITNIHNWWMEIFLQYGFIIFAGYLLFFGFLIWQMVISFKKAKCESEKMISEALLMGLVAFIVAAMSPSSFSSLNYNWLLIAFAFGYYRLRQRGGYGNGS